MNHRPPARADLTASVPPVRATPSLLVVDDDDTRRGLFRDFFTKVGYDVRALPDGSRLLDEVRRSPPDVLLLDVMLPGRSGYDLCAAIRKTTEGSELPIVLMSAQAPTAERIHRAFFEGADDFVPCPVRLVELKHRVGLRFRQMRERQALRWTRARQDSLVRYDMEPFRSADAIRACLIRALEHRDSLIVALVAVECTNAEGACELSCDIADVLAGVVRRSDIVASFDRRAGLVLVRRAPETQGLSVGQRLHAALEAKLASTEGTRVSVGVVGWDGRGPAPSPLQAVGAAERALHLARRRGGVVYFPISDATRTNR